MSDLILTGPVADVDIRHWPGRFANWVCSSLARNTPINRVQRVGAQAIVGSFLTVATSIAETEAAIPSTRERLWKRAIKLWIDIHTLPKTNPLHRITARVRKFYKSYRSPFHQVACRPKAIPLEELESFQPFTLAPWDRRVVAIEYAT
jgi:hypothetical protein